MASLGMQNRRAADALHLLFLGAVLGGYAGFIEAVVTSAAGDTMIAPADIVNIAAFYAIVWGFVGVVIGLTAWALAFLRQKPAGDSSGRIFCGSLLFSLFVFITVGVYVNVVLLPMMFSTLSLVFDAALLAGCVLLWHALVRLSRRSVRSRRGTSAFRSPLAVASVCLAPILIVTALVSTKKDVRTAGPAAQHADDINVILIVADALRPDHLGCYGYQRETSPNIDRLASHGVLFLNAYAQGPRTKETTASLVTSMYPSTHNVHHLADAIPGSSLTLMEAMQGAGYRTAIFSANALISPLFGFGRGVDYFYCETVSATQQTLLAHMLMRLGSRMGALRWLLTVVRNVEKLDLVPKEELPFAGGDAAAMNAAFLSWIDREAGTVFFAYLHYMEPHTPYLPPAPYDELFDPGYEGPKITDIPPDAHELLLPFIEADPLPQAQRTNMIAQYDGSIAYMDSELGKLMQKLRARGLSDRTLVVITADHGAEFYDHRGWGHGHSLFEELIRLPLILWCPTRLAGGRRLEATVRQIDQMPTMLGAAGLEELLGATELEGINLWPMLQSGDALPGDLPVMSEVFLGGQRIAALKAGEIKVIHTKFGNSERVMLFDLSEDPLEEHDLSTARPKLAESMLAQLGRMQDEAAARKRKTRRKVMDETTEEKLRALGYIR